jgi:hypothetical protein
MNEGTRSGKSTIRLLGISAERPTNGLYLYLLPLLFLRAFMAYERVKSTYIKQFAT